MKDKGKYVWSPWYNALVAGHHYRARYPGIKIEDCRPEQRNPNCMICKDAKS